MRALLVLAAFAMVAACGETSASPSQAAASPTAERFGTATLTETACNVEMPNNLPLRTVSFSLVNKSKYVGHFIFLIIEDGRTFKDLVDYWNSPMGQEQRPSFVTEIAAADVSTNSSDQMVATVVRAGTYAIHCGYLDRATNKVTGFWHVLKTG